jgi:hypothetical protein
MSGCQAANVPAALAVTTGFEFAISLADLGNPAPGSQIKIHAIYGNRFNDFLSNQVLAGVPTGTSSLGGDGNGTFTGTLSGIDFTHFAGNQYFTIQVPIPEPGTFTLFWLSIVVLVCRCRLRVV